MREAALRTTTRPAAAPGPRPRPRLYAQHLAARPFAEPGEPRLQHVRGALKSALSLLATGAFIAVSVVLVGRLM